MPLCPRRIEDGHGPDSPFNLPDDDAFVNGRCTYCGSLSGDEIMRRLEAGDAVCPTDKSYKIYFGNDKAYFQHLTEDQMRRFIDLLNDKKLKIGHPGYFYTRPYFIAPPVSKD